jgi:DNA-directed RNA polymerase subunit M/transcription elongation factor TFIIS
MTDEKRASISNGIWLCRECARKIDLDEMRYTVERLHGWKKAHEYYIASGKPVADAAREIAVTDGGIGSIVQNVGSGIGLDITHSGKGPAERVTVEGPGIGEIITNTGQGIGKRVTTTGAPVASECTVIVNEPVEMAVAMSVTTVRTTCSNCGNTFSAAKVIQGLAGDSEPSVKVDCPNCGSSTWI